MIEPKFNLRDASAKGVTAIILILNYNNKRVKIPTGHSVKPKYWNTNNERVKENKEAFDCYKINSDLEKFSNILKEAYKSFDQRDIVPGEDALKKKYFDLLNNPKKLNSNSSIWNYFDEFIEYQRGRILAKSVTDYDKALRKHLIATEKHYKIELSFNSLRNSGNFVDKMELYFNKEAVNANGETGMSLNTKGKQMKNLKSFLNWCFEKEYCQPFSIKHIVKHNEEVDNVYLTIDEQNKIYTKEFKEIELDIARDLLIVSCETGLRFSDFSRIQPEHINKNVISIYQQKTKSKVVVPISDRLREILNKYNHHLPNKSDKQRTEFNENVRVVCEKVGIKDSIVMQQTRGSITEEKYFKKHELVSSHTGRRSYCTNKFLKGIPVKVIMAVSGHKTEKAFMRYLKLNNQEIVTAFQELLIAV